MAEFIWASRTTYRIAPVRFRRAVTGVPVLNKPDPDDRGYRHAQHGPIVGISQGDTIIVKLVRTQLDDASQLHVTSSDTSIAEVTTPAAGTALSGSDEHEIHIRGVNGGRRTRPRLATIQVRHGSATGPIIGHCTAAVYRVLNVDLTVHWVTINQTGSAAAGIAPPFIGGATTVAASITNLLNMANAIWRPCGINLNLRSTTTPTFSFTTNGVVNDGIAGGTYELPTLFANTLQNGRTVNYVPRTINIWIVNQIGTSNFLGFGFSRANYRSNGLPNPGIVLGARTPGGGRSDLIHWANDIAHEVGHFFKLRHFHRAEIPNERQETWARRALMHPSNAMRRVSVWPAVHTSGANFAHRPRFDDIGYGTRTGGAGYRGCLITQKDVPVIRGDAESRTVRSTVLGSGGPY